MDIPVELARVLITELGDGQIIVLKEINGERSFPIQIGIGEALAIDRRIKGDHPSRPMTHDLLAGVIAAMGGEVEKVVINDLRGHTFIAALHIRRGNEHIAVDSRPSDAIALGAALNTPLFVAEKVLDAILAEPTAEERVEILRARLVLLEQQIDELTTMLSDEAMLTEVPPDQIGEHRRRLEQMRTEYDAIDQLLRKFG